MSFTQFILADNLITRYVLENPWPLVIILLLTVVLSRGG